MLKSLSGQARSTFTVNNIGLYPRVRTDTAGTAIVSQAGAVGLIETVRVAGLDRAWSEALEP